MRKYDAIILGGGRSLTNEDLPKGNTLFNGDTLAGRVYKEVAKGFDFDKIALVMNPDENITLRQKDFYVEPTFYKGAWLSGYNAIKKLENNLYDCVIIAGDLPFFDEKIIKKFMTEVEKYDDAGIIIPLISREVNEKKFPFRKRTYMPFKEGEFLAGNLGYISKEAVSKNMNLVNNITSSYQHKLKFIFKLISYVGINNLLRSNHPKLPLIKNVPFYEKIFPKFSINELEKETSKFLGITTKLIDFPCPESAFDIDRIDQLEYANEIYYKSLEKRLTY